MSARRLTLLTDETPLMSETALSIMATGSIVLPLKPEAG